MKPMYSAPKYLPRRSVLCLPPTRRRRRTLVLKQRAKRAIGQTTNHLQVGCPIRRSRDQRVLSPPPGLSQSATSFIASCRQGIHQTPFSRLIRSGERGSSLPGLPAFGLLEAGGSSETTRSTRPAHRSHLRRRPRQDGRPVSVSALDLERLSLSVPSLASPAARGRSRAHFQRRSRDMPQSRRSLREHRPRPHWPTTLKNVSCSLSSRCQSRRGQGPNDQTNICARVHARAPSRAQAASGSANQVLALKQRAPRAVANQEPGGACRDRTGDPLLAKQVLSQLS